MLMLTLDDAIKVTQRLVEDAMNDEDIIRQELEQKCWVPSDGEPAKRLYDLVFDINPAEICTQIEAGNLKNWCETIQVEMNLAMVRLPSAQPEVLACGSDELVQESGDLVKDLVKDCISRKMAIDAVNRINRTDNWKTAMIWALTSLPSAQPTQANAEPMQGSALDCVSRQAAIDAVDDYIGTFDAIDANFLDGLKTAKKLMMQLPSAQPEPCVDTIDALNESIKHFDDMAEECRRNANIERNDYMDMRDDAAEYRQLSTWLNELRWLRERFQSQPKRKKGKWKRNITAERDAQLIFTKVYNCSECGYESVGNNLKNFCPNCGCDMRGDEE